MNTIDNIKNKLIELYNKKNQGNPDKIDLDKNNKIDPFLDEFKKEILKHFQKKNRESDGEEIVKNEEQAPQLEGILTEEEIDKNILTDIEKNTIKYLGLFKLEYYKNSKEELKDTIKKEILRDYESMNFKENIIKRLSIFIDDLIEQEFRESQSKKDYLKKELLKKKLHEILPEVNGFFEKNTYDRLIRMTIFQRNNLLKYFIETLYNRHVQNDFIENKISEDEFIFLKDKIKEFVNNRYEKILSKEL